MNLIYLITILPLLCIIIIFYYELPRMHFISPTDEWEKLTFKKLEQLNIVDFNLNTHDNQKISLSSFNSKLIIIHFWSSSCVPCWEAITYLKQVYERYHHLGLEILGVSTDFDIDLWKKALAKEKMPWQQAVDYYTDKTKYSDLMMEWGITYIPFSLIIDKTGRILMIDPNYSETDKTLSQIFTH